VSRKIKYVCEVCGGDEIQMLCWIDSNTYEYIEYRGERYCVDCGYQTDHIPEAEWKLMVKAKAEEKRRRDARMKEHYLSARSSH